MLENSVNSNFSVKSELLNENSLLNKTQNVVEIIKYALISTHIKKDISPLSIMLIAPPEQNKTRILLQFSKIPWAETVENISAKPLDQLIVKQDKHKQKMYDIIILDFIRTLQHKPVVVDALSGTLLNLIDEGCKTSIYYGQEFRLKHRIQMGIITGITPPLFRKHFSKWNENGFITRFLPVSYEYSESTKNEVMNYIAHEVPTIINKTIITIENRGFRDIQINDEIASGILFYTDILVKRLKTFYVVSRHGLTSHKVYLDMQGFRLQKMLRLFAKSIAYYNQHDSVTFEDLNTFKTLCELIALPDNPKEI